MPIASAIVSVLLATMLLASGVAKLRRAPALMDSMGAVGVPATVVPRLAMLEIAATVGLLLGLFWAPIGIAAGVGAVLYFVGAVIAHLRVGDKALAPAAVLGVIAVASVVLQIAAL
ncbi:DoxX family protein [Microbacteriaceae bacterium VKM Ac-2854]|nr:DoxX family protein [Microbacteriaceae bacterium VKM Ac-2854]